MHQYYHTDSQAVLFKNHTILNKTISYIGRFYPEKNCDLLYDAFDKLSLKYPDYTFNFYGMGDSLNDKLVTNNINIFSNWLDKDEVNNAIQKSDFIIQSSISEGNPSIIWESFKNHTPVICSNIYGNNTAVTDGYNGYLFELDGYESIKHNMEMTNDELIHNIDKETTLNNLLNVIEKCININIDDLMKLQTNSHKSWVEFSCDPLYNLLQL